MRHSPSKVAATKARSKPKTAESKSKPVSRRDQYAEQTRQDILTAARELFSQRGYFSTTVEDIAKSAGVAAVTVYVAAGGKSGLLRTLTDIWSAAPILESGHKAMVELKDPVEVLRFVANTSRRIREEFGDIVILMLATAPHDRDVSESLSVATARYRKSIQNVVRHLVELQALKEDLSEHQAADILWFYFGYWGLYTLHVENGWNFDTAERWLCDAAMQALLRRPLPE